MSRCPFWSTKKQYVACSPDCPMAEQDENSTCIFLECAENYLVDIKDYIKGDNNIDISLFADNLKVENDCE